MVSKVKATVAVILAVMLGYGIFSSNPDDWFYHGVSQQEIVDNVINK